MIYKMLHQILKNKLISLFILSFIINLNLNAKNVDVNLNNNKIDRVLYITVDGVRWQNIFSERYLKKFKANYPEANFFGAPNTNYHVQVASIPVSQPSYHSQMAGKVTLCSSNSCGRIRSNTLLENLLQKLNLKKHEVAVFSSWPNIGLSAESTSGNIYTNTGNQLNLANRKDLETYELAKNYYINYAPKFMWVSLDEADSRAHSIDLVGYNRALHMYDDMLVDILSTLKSLGIYETTAIIITTDHGRGNGGMWNSHGSALPESKRTWAITLNTGLIPDRIQNNHYYFSTLSVRPTIEKILFNSAGIVNM